MLFYVLVFTQSGMKQPITVWHRRNANWLASMVLPTMITWMDGVKWPIQTNGWRCACKALPGVGQFWHHASTTQTSRNLSRFCYFGYPDPHLKLRLTSIISCPLFSFLIHSEQPGAYGRIIIIIGVIVISGFWLFIPITMMICNLNLKFY
jgi:hypothetical protein